MRRFVRNLQYVRRELNANECQRRRRTQTAIRNFGTNSAGKSYSLQAEVEVHVAAGGTAPQFRAYAVAARPTECWNCKKAMGSNSRMICEECGHLQDVDVEISYFDLLKFPKSFILEQQELTKRFRQLQTIVHPDKFSNKTSREQSNSADWSSLINKAYKTLSVPIERGQYILKLHGEQIPQDNSALDKQFLMEMMERNEEVEDATTREALQSLNEQIVRELNEKVAELSTEFQADALERAKSILVQMKYLLSIQQSIKNKLQALMGDI